MLSQRSALLSVIALFVSVVANAADYKAGEVLVKYKDNAVRTRATMNMIYEAAGVKSVRRYTGIMKGLELLILNDSIKVEDAVAALKQSDAVEYAQPNYIVRTQPARTLDDEEPIPGMPGGGFPCIPGFDIPGCDPNVRFPCLIPGLPFPPGCEDGVGPGPGPGPDKPEVQPAPEETIPAVEDPDLAKAYGLGKVGAPEAWKEHKGTKDIIVADIDTGVDYNHEDLSFNMWRNPNPSDKKDVVGFNFVHNDGLPYDDNSHGTHTSGSIGAVGGNGKGISGVSQRVSIMALKFLSGEGSGTTADAIRAIDYAVEHGAKILSNSWGGPAEDGNTALYDAIERAKAKDVLFIAAAGNDGNDNDKASEASYPAGFDNDNLIAVAATDEQDKLAFFSNYGKTKVHVAAPGVNVYSTIPGNRYKKESGTSMACPHVAGAAALVWSKHPNWNYRQVKKALMDSVDKLPSLNNKTVTGGRINVLKALHSTE